MAIVAGFDVHRSQITFDALGASGAWNGIARERRRESRPIGPVNRFREAQRSRAERAGGSAAW
jgi:hypothetical protein